MIALVADAAFAADAAGYVSQAKFFVKKGWYEDAQRELEAAVASDEGRIDPEAWYLLATVRYALLDVEGASAAAERAQTYARTDDQLYQAASYAQFLREQFGAVEIVPPYPGFVGRVQVEPAFPPIDPELKAYLVRLSVRHDGKATFPTRFALPIGEYTVNGAPVTIAPGELTVVERGAGDLGGSRLASAQLAKAEIGAGMALWFGSSVAALQPSPTLHVAVSQPVGGLVAGVFTDLTPVWYRTLDGELASSPQPWAVGARIGVELPGTDAVAIRPSLGWRMVTIPGVPRDCVADGDTFACAADGPADIVLYGVGLAHTALGELSVDYIDRSRKRTLGVGVKIVAEQAFGALPRAGDARLPDGEVVSFALPADERRFSATGVRFMPNLSIAF